MNTNITTTDSVEKLLLAIANAKDEFFLTHLALSINTTTKDPDEQTELVRQCGLKYAEFNAIAIAAKGGFAPRWN